MLLDTTFLKIKQVSDVTGRGRSTIYRDIKDETFPPGIQVGNQAVAWFRYEVDAINSASAAGLSRDETRSLVHELIEARKRSLFEWRKRYRQLLVNR